LALGPSLALAGRLAAGPPQPGPEELELGNGMRVSVVPVAGAQTFALRARIEAGPAYDPSGRAGLAAIAAEWLAWPVFGEDVRSPAIGWTRHGTSASPASFRWLELRATGWLGEERSLLFVLAGRLASAADAGRHGVRPELWERFRAAARRQARADAGSVDGQLWDLAWLWTACAVVVATLASRVIYGLRAEIPRRRAARGRSRSTSARA
jgi:hypothetical protein